jgi:hypothetical protein
MKNRASTMLVFVLLIAIVLGSSSRPAQASAFAKGGGGLSQAEIDGLLFVREEEKLAHDVYVVLYQKWGTPIFSNISSSETKHMAAIKNLLDYYRLPDPAAGKKAGEFTNPALQNLYNDLVPRGMISLPEALKVGANIEEIDIRDIESFLSKATHANIINVYNNLVAGSCNHLRAYVSNYEAKTGIVYQPQYLSLEVYQAIMNGTY